MRLELFDRDAVGAPEAPPPPQVQVTGRGWLLFNQRAGEFLHLRMAQRLVVSLLFDAEVRQAAIRPEQDPGPTRSGTQWNVQQMRGRQWPLGVDALQYVTHYRIAQGMYVAQLMRGPGPRMVLFDVGPAQDLPDVAQADRADQDPGPARSGTQQMRVSC